ncbi:MAG: hypothetical protein ABI472_23240, partial [Ginsengibacter sp.]
LLSDCNSNEQLFINLASVRLGLPTFKRLATLAIRSDPKAKKILCLELLHKSSFGTTPDL